MRLARIAVYSILWASGASFLLQGTSVAGEGWATYFTHASCIREGNSGIMANGQNLDDEMMICALPWKGRPDGREIMVTNIETGKSIVVTWADKGPGKGPRKRGVVIDLSKKAFEEVCGDTKQGRCRVGFMEVK